MRRITRFLSLLLVMLFTSTTTFADFVEVGGGTSGTSYVPVYGFYDYSWSRVIYLQTELGDAITMEKVAYQLYNSSSSYVMPNQQIWLKHTTDATFPSSAYIDPGANGFTKVYDGTITFNGVQGDWIEIEFNVADFDYNGTDNLIVLYENRDGDYASGYPRWYYNYDYGRVNYRYADGSFPTTSGSTSGYVPNTRFFYTPVPPATEGTMHGMVENTATGDPVVGATITATETTSGDVYNWMSGENGEYYFPTPAGTFDLTFAKIGFAGGAQNGVVVVLGDTTEVPDVTMTETAYQPMFATATVNATDDACLVEWGLPSGDYEIVYDDGVAENMIAWFFGGNMNAVKFTPAGYPADLTGGSVYVGDGAYPAGGAFIGVDFGIAVYDDNGVNGMPGALLDSIVVTPNDFGWVEFTGLDVTIEDGDFYIAMVQGGDYPDCAPIGIDETPPQKFRSYSRNASAGAAWAMSAYQDFMIRAQMNGPQAGSGDFAKGGIVYPSVDTRQMNSMSPANTPNYGTEGTASYKPVQGATRGVDHYMVYRVSDFDPEDPMDPGVETLLNNNVSGLSYNDNGFGAQPSGYYRYNVYAVYESGEVSDAAVTNVVGHALRYDVTFEITTTDGNSPEGAHVLMTGLEYPYEVYEAFAPASGIVVFEEVWDGTYDYSVNLNGYDPYEMMGVTIDEVTTIPVMLSETKNPPRGLYVDEVTQVAVWFEPGEFPGAEWNFNAGIPADFTIVNGGTCNATWEASTYGGGLDGTQMAFVNSDGAGSACGTMDEEMITSEVNTAGVSQVYLDFDQFFQQYVASIGDVDVWDGTAWQTVYSVSSNIGGWGAPNHQQIDITAYANVGMKIRFHYYNADWDYWWAIDNVKVWDGVGGKSRDLTSYNVYLDGAWVGSTAADVTTWTYQNLNFGQTYVAGVGAVYSSGVSEIITYEFTAAFLPPPRNLEGEVMDHDAILTWDYPVEGGPYGDGDRSDIVVSASTEAESHEGNASNGGSSDAQFDLQFSYDVDTPSGLTGLAGAETDGNFFYVTKWANNQIVKFNMDGSFVETFSIGGVSGLRDLAYDGTYFYGGAASTTIYEMDFNSQTLVSTISSASAARAIAYDQGEDGFWVNNWDSDLTLTSRAGATLNTISNPPSIYGMAYDNISAGGPFLWVFSGTSSGGGCQIEQMDIATGNLTGLSHSVSGDLGASGIAGGLWIQPDIVSGFTTIGGLMQASPDLLFGYELVAGGGGGGGGQAPNLIAYNVYRDGGFIAQTAADTRTYTDVYAPAGTHEYSVTAVYEAPTAGESLEEGPIELYIYGEGAITGNVSVMGTPLVPLEGATVTAYREVGDELIYEAEATTDMNGSYTMTVLEASYTVMCEADGFEPQEVSGQSVANGGNTIVDFIMLEFPDPALGVTAERNMEKTQVDVNWYEPSNYYYIIYDNDDATNVTAWDVAGNFNAVKFTPEGYPTDVLGFMVNVYDGSWPSGNNLQPFTMFVALADGEDGMPGTMLDSITVTPANYGWVEFDFNGASTVEEGDFYLVMRQDTDYPNCTPIAVDATAGANRSYNRYATGGRDWELSTYQDYMIRAKVYGDNSGRAATEFNTELDLTQGSVANSYSKYPVETAQVNSQKIGKFVPVTPGQARDLEYYNIYRLEDGQQNDPSVWTMLAEGFEDTHYIDLDWTTLEQGYYVYAVVSVYTYNQSAPAFSNVVPRLFDFTVTVNVSTNTGDSPEGAYVELSATESSDRYYDWAPEDGVTPLYWVNLGWYNLEVSKPGYDSYVLEGLYVNQDLTIDAVLNEACLPPQMFHVTMDGIATWLPPVLDYEEVFFEGFEGGMIPSGWTQITDPNMNPDQWVVQTGGAGGHPAGAFEGEYNALFNGSSAITKLVTPEIDLGGAIAPELSFWFAQPASSGQDKLSVFYKNSASGSWEALMSEAGDVQFWTKKNIELPNPTATYYIAFEGTAPETGGYGVSLDNVRVVKGVEPGDDRALEGYNVYLNGVFQDFTTELTYTYTGLTVTQAYIGGVSAKYTNCESPIVLYPFTYYTCDFFAPIRNLEASLINCDVQLTWEPPGDLEPQEYDIIYTDDTPENATAWNVVNSENALRMTPAGYPCDVLTVSVNIYDGTWPAGNILNPMEILVYAGDGTGGLPGTMLGSKVVTPTAYNWVDVDVSDLGITITDGDFYVSHKQIGTYPDCPPTAIDEGAGVNRSYSRVDGDPWGVASYQDFMFKAHVYGMYFGDRVIDGGSVNVPATANAAALTANEPVVQTGMQDVQNGKFVYADGREMRALRGYNVYRDGDKINDVLLGPGSTVYTDTPPYGGVYVYGVTAEYDEGHACAVEVEVDVCGHLPAPTDLQGEGYDDALTAHLWWNAPSTSLSTWMYYDDGVYASSIGAGEAQFDVAIRFPVDVLGPYDGLSMTTLRIYMSTSGVNSLYTGKVWTKDGAGDPEVVAEIEIDEAAIVWDAWNDYELETPLVIDATKELWFGYYIDEPDGDFAAAGSAVADDGLGNMIYYGGAWATLLELAPTLDYNWMIRGYVTDDAGDRMEMSAIANTATYNTFGELANTNVEPQATVLPTGSRAVLLGYNVYRDGDDEPVNMDVIPDTTYDDVDLLPGLYEYIVTAVYDEGESYPEGPIEVLVGTLPVPPANLAADVQCYDVVLTWGDADAKLWDDFEMYADFTLDLSPWILNDVDGSTTYGFTGISFPNSGAAMAFIAFNSLATDPPMDENLAYSGDKFAACFAATTPPNNDWMITPMLMIDEGDVFSFMAKTYTDQYGLERFKVAVSTTGTNPEDFTVISEGDYVEAPADAYGMFEYDLSAYAGQEIHIAINCVSNDAFIFMVDDVYVGPAGKARSAANPAVHSTVARAEVAWNGEVYAPSSKTRALQGYNVFMDDVQVNTELIEENTYTVMDLEPGTYGFQVNAVYDEGTSERTDVVEATIEEYVAVSDLEGEINDMGYPELTWSAPVGRALESYKVYREGEMIAEGLTETMYVDEEDLPDGTYCYTIVAVYTDCESVPSNAVCLDITGINDINGNELSVYPNPATDVVNVRHSGQIEQITVVNAVGQVVAEIMTNETNVAINVSTYESGVYMLRMRAADGTLTTKRVTIAE